MKPFKIILVCYKIIVVNKQIYMIMNIQRFNENVTLSCYDFYDSVDGTNFTNYSSTILKNDKQVKNPAWFRDKISQNVLYFKNKS